MPRAAVNLVFHTEVVIRESDGATLLLVESHVERFRPRKPPLAVQIIDPRLRRA